MKLSPPSPFSFPNVNGIQGQSIAHHGDRMALGLSSVSSQLSGVAGQILSRSVLSWSSVKHGWSCFSAPNC